MSELFSKAAFPSRAVGVTFPLKFVHTACAQHQRGSALAAAAGSCDAAVFSGGCGGVVSSISCTHRMDELLDEDFPSEEEEEFEEIESPNPRR